MSKGGLVLISDLHLANRKAFSKVVPDPAFKGCNSRLLEILSTINWSLKYAVNNDCEGVVILGDIFHDRGTISVPVFNAFYSLLSKYRGVIPVYAFPGNHDFVDSKALWGEDGFNSLYCFSDIIHVVHEPGTVTHFNSFNIKMIPFNINAENVLKEATNFSAKTSKVNLLMLHHGIDGAVFGPANWSMPHTISPDQLPSSYDHIFCVDDQTEALTKKGWVKYTELNVGDLIATSSEDGEFLWSPIQQLNSFRHTGDMLHIGGDGGAVDHFSTLDHDLWLCTKIGISSSHGIRNKSFYTSGWKKWKAKDIGKVTRYIQVSASKWDGTFYWPSDALINGEKLDLAEFIGWYISEGSTTKYQVNIAQSKLANSDKYFTIKSLLLRLGLTISEHDFMLRICSKDIALWVASVFNTGHLNKYIPDWVKAWPSPLLEKLLLTAVSGDGHICHTDLMTYHTTSAQLAVDIQEIALKIGWGCTVSSRTRPNRQTCWDLTLVKSNIRMLPIKRREVVTYNGIVWCPTVESGLWFMRRNGKVAVTGNSGHYHKHQTIKNRITYIGSPIQHDLGERDYVPGIIHILSDGSWKHISNTFSPRFVYLETSSQEEVNRLDSKNYNVVTWTGDLDIGEKVKQNEDILVEIKPDVKTLVKRTSIQAQDNMTDMMRKYVNVRYGEDNSYVLAYGMSLYRGDI